MSGNSIIIVGRASGLDTAQYMQILWKLRQLGLEQCPLDDLPEECPLDDLPAATWQVICWDPDTEADFTVNLRAGDASVLKQLCRICNGQPVRVTAELPPPSSWPASSKRVAEHINENGKCATYTWRLDSPDVELTVTRLEILGKPVTQEVAS